MSLTENCVIDTSNVSAVSNVLFDWYITFNTLYSEMTTDMSQVYLHIFITWNILFFNFNLNIPRNHMS